MSEAEEGRSKSKALAANERVKAISGVLVNLGTALVAATVARVYVEGGINLTTGLWSVAAFATIYSRWKLLSLLRSEDEI